MPVPYQNATSGIHSHHHHHHHQPTSGFPISAFPTGSGPKSLPSGLPTSLQSYFGGASASLPSSFPTSVPGYGPLPSDSGLASSVTAGNLLGHPLTMESGGGRYGPLPTASPSGPAEGGSSSLPLGGGLPPTGYPSGPSESAAAASSTGFFPGGPKQSATGSAPGASALTGSAPTSCAPPLTVTESSTYTVTVTASSAPVSVAPLSSAPFTVPGGNGTLSGTPTGTVGTVIGTGIGTGYGTLPTFTFSSTSIDYIPTTTASVGESATSAAVSTAALHAYY